MKLIKTCLISCLDDRSLYNLIKIVLESPAELSDIDLKEFLKFVKERVGE